MSGLTSRPGPRTLLAGRSLENGGPGPPLGAQAGIERGCGRSLEYRGYTQLYVEARPCRPGVIDLLLRAIADDELANVILVPTDLRWLYHGPAPF
jgi:hypothetical protein